MADVRAPSGWYPDLQIPSILRWWDGQTWTGDLAPVGAPAASSTQVPTRARPSPARVPELVPIPAPGPFQWGGDPGRKRDLDEEAAELFQTMAESGVRERDDLRTELADLTGQVPTLRQERDDLRTELADLTGQVPTLRQERDDLRTELADLTGQVPTLRRERDDLRTELADLTGQVPTLRRERDDLRTELADLTGQVPTLRRDATTCAPSLRISRVRSRPCGESATTFLLPPSL